MHYSISIYSQIFKLVCRRKKCFFTLLAGNSLVSFLRINVGHFQKTHLLAVNRDYQSRQEKVDFCQSYSSFIYFSHQLPYKVIVNDIKSGFGHFKIKLEEQYVRDQLHCHGGAATDRACQNCLREILMQLGIHIHSAYTLQQDYCFISPQLFIPNVKILNMK